MDNIINGASMLAGGIYWLNRSKEGATLSEASNSPLRLCPILTVPLRLLLTKRDFTAGEHREHWLY
jgi:hypothetical protein